MFSNIYSVLQKINSLAGCLLTRFMISFYSLTVASSVLQKQHLVPSNSFYITPFNSCFTVLLKLISNIYSVWENQTFSRRPIDTFDNLILLFNSFFTVLLMLAIFTVYWKINSLAVGLLTCLMIAIIFNNCVRLAYSQKCIDTIERKLCFTNKYHTTLIVLSAVRCNCRIIVLVIVRVFSCWCINISLLAGNRQIYPFFHPAVLLITS